ncbi:MAG: anaerobic sulfatase maturase [Candidatus Poribacteria bacterium]|nr:MAG: anaerobic sulfatase maturase [Candidatus Poribacteria bacterium]
MPIAPFHLMTKPIGPICNLDCKYCYYLEKENLYPKKHSFRMDDRTLELYIRQYIEAQEGPEVPFAWQGGEPTLMGLDFFKRVVELQQKYCPPGKRITNALQTNGTLLNDEWCAFFKEHGFLIGISIDGPQQVHDRYRVDKGGRPTWHLVMRGLECLKRHQVEFNTLTVVHRYNSKVPLEVYRFLKEQGSRFMQFIPIVERVGEGSGRDGELLWLAPPPRLRPDPDELEIEGPPVTPWSVRPLDYGNFLIAIFDEWVRNDVGKVFIQIIEVQLGNWMGLGASLCVFTETCGRALVLEHNGDVYSCDHYVYPEYKLGNIHQTPIQELVESEFQRQFGLDKRETLPRYCLECDVRFACNGECPKHRFLKTPEGEPGLNYLCAGYKKFFRHIDPYMKTMAALLRRGQSPALIMEIVRREDAERAQARRWATASRNDPCPCGSGKKYKHCHWEQMRGRGAQSRAVLP